MRLYDWGFLAVSLLIFGGADEAERSGSKLLHVEVLEVLSPAGCEQTAQLAEEYLMPEIPGADRVAYVCHSALRDSELASLQAAAAARNAELAAAEGETLR